MPVGAGIDFLETTRPGVDRAEVRGLTSLGAEVTGAGQALERAAEDPRDLPVPAQTIPVRSRFVAWSRRYLAGLIGADMVIGGMAAAIPASISNTLSRSAEAVPVLCLVGMVVWPMAIALRGGYRRDRIGVGPDELRAAMRAASLVVVACALPTGFLTVRESVM